MPFLMPFLLGGLAIYILGYGLEIIIPGAQNALFMIIALSCAIKYLEDNK